MILYRILTENKNYEDVCNIVSAKFGGFTVIKADGYWQAQAKHSLIIELLVDELSPHHIESLCYKIKKLNNQQAVLVQIIECRDIIFS